MFKSPQAHHESQLVYIHMNSELKISARKATDLRLANQYFLNFNSLELKPRPGSISFSKHSWNEWLKILPSDIYDIKTNTFFAKLVFEGITFQNYGFLNFNGATFKKGLTFSNCHFRNELTYTHCTFEESAVFETVGTALGFNIEKSTFWGDCIIKDMSFYDGTKGINFNQSKFSSSLQIENLKTDLSHLKCTQHNQILLSNIETKDAFKAKVTFASIGEETEIVCVYDKGIPSEAKGSIVFSGLSLSKERQLILKGLSSGNKLSFHFNNCEFEQESVLVSNTDLTNRLKVSGEYTWKGFVFENCTWPSIKAPSNTWLKDLPKWFKTSHQALPDEEFQESSDRAFASNRSALYAKLKEWATKEGDKQRASSFYFFQMYWDLQANPKQLIKQFYYWTSAFGTSCVLPLIWLGFIVFALFLAITLNDSFSLLSAKTVDNWSKALSWVFPVSRLHSGFEKYPWYVSSALILLQSLIGYLLFQTVAAIRNNVKQ